MEEQNQNNNGNTIENKPLQPTQTDSNAVNVNPAVDNLTPLQPQEPLAPNVEPVAPQVNSEKGDRPLTHVDSFNEDGKVQKRNDLPSAKEADVGTKTTTRTKEEKMKKDKLLDGLPGIGVPEKTDNSNNTTKEVKQENVEIVKEKVTLKKKVQYFFTAFFFILVALFIYFLPEIEDYLSTEKSNNEVVTSGFLTCELERTSEGITSKIKDRFTFSKEKLKSYKREVTHEAPASKKEILSEYDDECEALNEATKSLSGVDVACSFSKRKQFSSQSIDYQLVNVKKLTSAFSEAGGTYPDYALDDNIKDIESTMITSGFSCKRTKT